MAEFKRDVYDNLSDKEIVYRIADLRNTRLSFTDATYDLDSSIYHCVLREENKFLLFEEEMHYINLEEIQNIKRRKNSIIFNDNKSEYSFLLSKSTLQKRFNTQPTIYEFDVNILKDPLSDLYKFFSESDNLFEEERRIKQTIYLPLYGSNKTVYDKSGLNQWNAGGRERNLDEVYIPVPVALHHKFPKFFPNIDVPFILIFPNNERVKAKMCQAGRKALMTKSNRILGKLILRDGLKLREGELATYEKLQLFGIDSVRIDKINNLEFEINFSKVDSFENYKNSFL
ncbi:MAG: NgoFVII family restriction endonuclease [Verrucomicrobiota bacterium]|nr:NgoFVII family restriction endonuclease [Verrucomicrobiota bacterium]